MVSAANEERTKDMTTDLVMYLSFDGQCEAAFKHYERILGGRIVMMMRYADAPADAGVAQRLKRPIVSCTPGCKLVVDY